MQIPESINKLTKDVEADKFNTLVKPQDLPIDEIVFAIKKSLTTKTLADFEYGLAFYKKDISSDRQVIKNFIYLLNECVDRAIKESDINVDYRDNISFNAKQLIEGIGASVDALYNILFNLNQQKNLLDVSNITFIILGYAIGLIKKIRNS